MTTGLVYSTVYLEHDTGMHVENAGRLRAIMDHLKVSGALNGLKLLEPRDATVDEVAMVHAEGYIEAVRAKATGGGAWLDADTYVSPASYEVAMKAAGGAILAVETVMSGKVENAFALVRPPGHHALRSRAKGFCVFNNVAVAAKYAMKKYGLRKAAIVDFDVHHGDGTQEAFDADDSVLYCSTHQMPLYPGTGYMEDNGVGKASGTKVNVPLPPGSGDYEYVAVYREVMAPAVERFGPDLILVSAGYVAHWADRLASMQMTVTGFAGIVRLLKKAAERVSGGRLVFSLEGGYDQEQLPYSVGATLDVLQGKGSIEDPLGFEAKTERPTGIDEYVQLVREFNRLG